MWAELAGSVCALRWLMALCCQVVAERIYSRVGQYLGCVYYCCHDQDAELVHARTQMWKVTDKSLVSLEMSCEHVLVLVKLRKGWSYLFMWILSAYSTQHTFTLKWFEFEVSNIIVSNCAYIMLVLCIEYTIHGSYNIIIMVIITVSQVSGNNSSQSWGGSDIRVNQTFQPWLYHQSHLMIG